MTYLLGIIYFIVIIAVLFCISALLFRGENTTSNKIYVICQSTVILWCFSQILLMLSQTINQLYASYIIGNLGICFIGSTWFYFCLSYANKKINKFINFIPLALSVFHFIIVATNNLHHLYYSSFSFEIVNHNIFFYTNVVSTYVCVFYGAYVLYKAMNEDQRLARRLVIASVIFPVILNAIFIFDLLHVPFDVTPLGFSVSVVFVYLATTKYKFMNIRRELAITNEKLLLEKERNRIAQQVHDTAGHTLTIIQSYMKLAEVSANNQNYDEVKSYLSEARTLTGKGIKELRESINMLRQEAEYELVTQGIMQLANQVKEFPVEVTVKGNDDNKYSHLSKTIYDTVRESITNTLKYANASKIDIIIKFQSNSIELMIADDGIGCDNIIDNNGLTGIRERITKVGGTVRFSSEKGQGFLTRIKLPVK